MSHPNYTPNYEALIREFCAQPSESPWWEFKRNVADHEKIGRNLSALSNSAALEGQKNGYLIWGIDDKTHEVCGTDFIPSKAKHGNIELESWLMQMLSPKIPFKFITINIDGLRVVILEIPAASHTPTQFHKEEWIRIGSNTKSLKDHPEIEKKLWRFFDQTPFEAQTALEDLTNECILECLDYIKYFEMRSIPIPENESSILSRLEHDKLLTKNVAGRWVIPNLSALLFAKNIQLFPSLGRKALRVIRYDGNSRIKTISERTGQWGYAIGFENAISYIQSLTPGNEVIEKALRKRVPMYPVEAIRELVANALIHQDFSITGAGPMVEVFSDRIEITNPGVPLIDTLRFVDSSPQSRNEQIAFQMRMLGVCEERGSGIDKVIFQTELYQLPAPLFESYEGFTRTTLFSHKHYKDMDPKDRIRACYLHACLRHVNQEKMTNTTLRERFGIHASNSAMISRVIKDTVKEGAIRPRASDQSRRNASYIPFWA